MIGQKGWRYCAATVEVTLAYSHTDLVGLGSKTTKSTSKREVYETMDQG
jgi:hypothetical protein